MFLDRREAGRALGAKLASYAGRKDVTVLGLPRGGLPVAFEVALVLDVPLDVFLVRKLGAPGQEELAMGAIASGGVRILNPTVIQSLRISADEIERTVKREERELRRRELSYRGDWPPLDVEGRIAILVDDGLATGSSMRAAVAAARKLAPVRIVVAVPVAPPSTAQEMRRIADDVVCVATPEPFYSVGSFYEDFDQTTDEEVRELLRRSAALPVQEKRLA
ncbi:MAG: phosphoribosyltransferase [Acidobacteriota bacterium]|nr:phosphoribosyltransferase [Acidobacteriota bacterium]MDQ5870649.1 phosphoribosyltransferase [Acidobacteriota bacterium]